MKIAYITAGAAGMYCGSCLHDNTLAAELGRQGHDVLLVPTYTPIRTDETDVSGDQVFFGAINVFLQQKSWLFRHTPRALDWLLDRPALLDRVGKMGASTSARQLGEMTHSMLLGEAGPQVKELERLTRWLEDHFRPDVIHLTNSMFLGFARTLRERLGAPIVCSLQGEDLFLDGLEEPHRSLVLGELEARASDADAWVAPSRYYAERMSPYLGVHADDMNLVRLGIRVDDLGPHASGARSAEPFRIGYLARIAPEKGLHLLAEAFVQLARELGQERLELHVAGYLGPRDTDYFAEVQRTLSNAGLSPRVRYHGELERTEKSKFLSGLDVFALPTVYREAKGLSALEALACGTPIIVPDHGGFPEMTSLTGGAKVVEPGSVEAVREALRALLEDPDERKRLGSEGQRAVHAHFTDWSMAEATVDLYRKLLSP